MKQRRWNEDQRRQHSQLIHNVRPWESVQAPRTPEGLAISKMNALRTGLYAAELREARRHLAECRRLTRNIAS